MYSHCELSLPSAGDQLSELDHFEDESEFLTRDLMFVSILLLMIMIMMMVMKFMKLNLGRDSDAKLKWRC